MATLVIMKKRRFLDLFLDFEILSKNGEISQRIWNIAIK